MKLILGIVFVLVGLAWGWRIIDAFRRAPRAKALGMVVDFASGYAVDLVLIIAIECLGILMILGR